MLFEGPYACEHSGILDVDDGQLSDISEGECHLACESQRDICKFFLYTPELAICTLYMSCDRLVHHGLAVTNKLFGMFSPRVKYCHIADPELCWIQTKRRSSWKDYQCRGVNSRRWPSNAT